MSAQREIHWEIRRVGGRRWTGWWTEEGDVEHEVSARSRRKVLRAIWDDVHRDGPVAPEGGDLEDLWNKVAAEGRAEFG